MPIYSKPQEQYLLDEFNRRNPDAVMPVDETNVVFGKPAPLEPAKPGDADTRVILRAKQRRGYVGNQSFDYTQLDIATYFKNIVPRVALPNITKLSQAVQYINGKYGLNLKTSDVEELTLVPNKKFIFRMSPTCLQWRGSVEMLYKPGPLELGVLVVNKKLDVLAHPVPIDGRRCAKMISWGIDYTENRPLIQSMTPGGLSGGVNQQSGRTALLINMMMSHGFPEWNFVGSKWATFATTAVEDCNKQYDMVAVISNVNDDGISGDIYLHYNV
jgi:hypothetical protein